VGEREGRGAAAGARGRGDRGGRRDGLDADSRGRETADEDGSA